PAARPRPAKDRACSGKSPLRRHEPRRKLRGAPRFARFPGAISRPIRVRAPAKEVRPDPTFLSDHAAFPIRSEAKGRRAEAYRRKTRRLSSRSATLRRWVLGV